MTENPKDVLHAMERELATLSAQIAVLEDRLHSASTALGGAARERNEDLLNDLRHKRAAFERDVRRLRMALGDGWEEFYERAATSCRELPAAIERSMLWFA